MEKHGTGYKRKKQGNDCPTVAESPKLPFFFMETLLFFYKGASFLGDDRAMKR